MSQEPRRKRNTSGIRWRVASANKLDSFEGDPLKLLPVPKTAVFYKLPDECNYFLIALTIALKEIVPEWRRHLWKGD
jgi:hypothetical protein